MIRGIVASTSARVAGVILATVMALYAAPLKASVPALWSTFSQPGTIVTVDLRSYNNPDILAQTTLMGAYNQLQSNTRLYIIQNNQDQYWLNHLVPSTITVTPLFWNQTDQNGALKAMLAGYGTSIKGAIIYDPSNSESVNVATTLAGIDDAMVVSPTELSIVQSYNLPILADLRTTVWIGSDSNLVNNTTINKISNPGGGQGTTGWALCCNGTGMTLGTGTGSLLWNVNANLGHDVWVQYVPSLTAGNTYIFSVQLSGSGKAFLDGFDGVQDWTSSEITLSSTPQTLQLSITIPQSYGTPVFEVRSHGVTASSVNIQNAAVVRNRVASEQYSYEHYLNSTNKSIMAILPSFVQGSLRDYIIAGKMFVFDLSSTNADESALMSSIISYTPHNTPILGYIDSEGTDVPFLSSATLGHFLNASDYYSNGAIWAALPGPSILSEPAPVAVKAQNGYVYVGSWFSDGDNASFVENSVMNMMTSSQYLGAVPIAWTMPPGMLGYAPLMIAHINSQLPQSNEMMAGPSGIGYATQISGSDLTTFGELTGESMVATGMSSVTDWFVNSSNVVPFVSAASIPHDVHATSYPYTLQGNTVIDGQYVSYENDPDLQVAAIKNAGWSATAPTFVESLTSGWSLNPDDMLYVAQRLQTTTGHNYVFMTPSELALTEKNYYAGTTSGLANSNAQAVLGSQLVAAYPNNLVWNGNGRDAASSFGSGTFNLMSGAFAGEYVQNATYNGVGCLKYNVPANPGTDRWTVSYLGQLPLQTYVFSVALAGSGQAFIDVWDGSTDHQSAVVTLSSTFQTVTLSVMLHGSSSQLQIRVHNQSTPTTVYFKNQSVTVPNWQISNPSASGTTFLNSAQYQNSPALQFQVAPGLGVDEWASTIPPVTVGKTYTFSVDVAGSGQAFLDAWNGSADVASSVATLTAAYQTLKVTTTIQSGSSVPQLQIRAHSQSTAPNIYFRNASVILQN